MKGERVTSGFAGGRLLSIADLSDQDIASLLARAAEYRARLAARAPIEPRLQGRTQINLFFEDSTRTNMSFALAGQRLGAHVLNVPVAASSVHKGESLLDTAKTLAAMDADAMILRTREEGLQERLAEELDCAVINGGAGAAEHPTQALLDAATLKAAIGDLEGATIAICGDVRHSRVARSNAALLPRLGAALRFVGPAELLPEPGAYPHIERFDAPADGFAGADAVMALRLQKERMESALSMDAAAFHEAYGLTHETLAHAKPGAFAMHPGPMNRGIEIAGALADDPDRSLVLRQVAYGVPTRMACLDLLLSD